jgi:hypothetical protein
MAHMITYAVSDGYDNCRDIFETNPMKTAAARIAARIPDALPPQSEATTLAGLLAAVNSVKSVDWCDRDQRSESGRKVFGTYYATEDSIFIYN